MKTNKIITALLAGLIITAIVSLSVAEEEETTTEQSTSGQAVMVLPDGTTVQVKKAPKASAPVQALPAETPKPVEVKPAEVKPGEPAPLHGTAPAETAKPATAPADLRTAELSYTNAAQLLNINKSSKEEIQDKLGITSEDALAIVDYRMTHGQFKNVFDIANVPGIDASEFTEKIKPNVKIVYKTPSSMKRGDRILRAYDRLAYQNWNAPGIQEHLEDYLKYPVDANSLTFDDLLEFPNVTPVGALAIVKHRKERGPLSYVGQLNRVRGLDYWAYTNLRDYVKVKGEKPRIKLYGQSALAGEMEPDSYLERKDVHGNFRFTYEDWPTYTPFPAEWAIALGSAPYTGEWWQALKSVPRVTYKVRTTYKDNIKFGLIADRPFSGVYGSVTPVFNYKGYLGFENYGIIKKAYLGNYYLSLGEGLIVNNGDDYFPRKSDIVNGLYGDLSYSQELKFTGAATQLRYGKFDSTLFYSNDRKDVIMNKSSDTVNYYLFNRYGYSAAPGQSIGAVLIRPLDNMGEQDYGINLNFHPADSSVIGITHFVMDTEKAFDPDPSSIIKSSVLNDFIYGDYKALYNPDYMQLFKGKTRRFYGTSFTQVIDNVALSGEYARLQDAQKSLAETAGKDAYIFSALAQFNNFHVKGIYRHYDLGYDNPYAKTFTESGRFYDNILKYNYKYSDYYDGRYVKDEGDLTRPSLYFNMYDTPNMKAEEGFYLETRWQMAYKWTLNRAFVDFWRYLGDNTLHFYAQGELEYRPVYEVRISWKEKFRAKNVQYQRGNIHEQTLRVRGRLSSRDGIDLRYFILRYEFGTRPDFERFHAETSYNDFIQARLTHNFNDFWRVESAFTIWSTTNFGYLWDFEDTNLDFMNNNGYKYYFIVTDKLSDNIRMHFKTRVKTTIVDTEPTTTTRAGKTAVDGIVLRDDYSFFLQFDYDF